MIKIKEDLKNTKNPILIDVAKELIRRGDVDPSLKRMYEKKHKSLNGLWKYLMSEMQKRAVDGAAGALKEEVYGMAQHYYDEDSIGVENEPVISTNKPKEIKLPEESLDIFDI